MTGPVGPGRWTPAAAAGVLVDVAAFAVATLLGAGLEAANAAAFVLAAATGALFLRHLPQDPRRAESALFSRSAAVGVAVLAFPMQAGVLSLGVGLAGWHPLAAFVPAALAAAAVVVAAMVLLPSRPADPAADRAVPWARVALLAIAYLLAIRLVYLGQLELVPQEAYYWNFARHLDLGYLDHPPLVAWLIAATTAAGDHEFLVRLPAVVCSLVTIGFASALARDLAGPAVAWRTALLAAVLPFFFGVGFLMTPDAPLTAAWAAALYFLNRALRHGEPAAWLGAGLAIGLGMLAKYTMVLVPVAALAFVVVERRLVSTLRRAGPWLGALVAGVVFTPVLIWNARHDWASFTYQGARRLAAKDSVFELHLFLLFPFLLLTPWGVAGFARGLARARRRDDERAPPSGDMTRAGARFCVVFTLVPLVWLAVPSLWTETKFHWTGPIWLAALPLIAASLRAPRPAGSAPRVDQGLERTWPGVVLVLMAVYALGLFYYPVYGLAGIHRHHRYIETGWRDLRAQVQRIEDEVARETGRRPAIVGLDRNALASQLAFYDPRGDGWRDTAARNLVFAEPALMYEFWFSPGDFAGRDLVVVSCERGAVEDPRLAPQSARLGPVHEIHVRKGGTHTRDCFARVLYGFSPAAPTAPPPGASPPA